VIITASAKIQDERDAMKAGANDFIRKPFSPKSLHEKLNLIILEDKQKWLDSLVNAATVSNPL